MQKIALVTGASSGIGAAITKILAQHNIIVYAATRNTENICSDKNIIPIKLDLTNNDSIKNCINEIMHNHYQIDFLINNAGYGSYGAIENVDLDEAYQQFEINLFSIAKLIKLVTPIMRDQMSGRIINISSIASKIPSKFGGWYCASKFALEGFSDCLRMELKQFNIQVVLVEPGIIKTNWGPIAANHLKNSSINTIYSTEANKVADVLVKNYASNFISSPDVIAKVVYKAISSKHPKTRYCKGYMARPMIFLRKILTDRAYDKFYDWLMKIYN